MLEGKKTYITAAIGLGLAGAQAAGVQIPDWTWPLLGSLGFGFLRAGVSKSQR